MLLTGEEDLARHDGGAHVCDCLPPLSPLSVWLTAIFCLCFLELGSAPHFTAPHFFSSIPDTFALEGRYCDEFLPRAGRPYNITVCSFNRQRGENVAGLFTISLSSSS